MNLIKNDRAGLKYSATIIMVICAVTFTHTLGFYFLNLDDNLGITMNPMIHQGLSLESIKWAFSTFNSPYYMPLTRISFLIDSSLFGVDAWGFHLTNLLIHTTNSLLILLLFWKLSNHLLFSTLSAIAFAIHPQHLEAFIWISERKEVLSALFGLLSLIFYTRYAQTRAANSSNTSNFKYYLYAILYFLLSLMAKPLWISMPFIFLLIDWWPLNRIKHDPLKIIIIDKIPFIFLAVIFIIITLASAASSVDQISNSAETLPLIQRVLNIPVVYITYLLLTIYPYDLPVYLPYPREYLPYWQVISCSIVIILFTCLCIIYRKRYPQFLMGWLWFLGTLIPMTGLVSAGESVFIANRWTYLPHIGLLYPFIWMITNYYLKHPKLKIYTGILIICTIMGLSYSSWSQARYWKNSELFWQQAINTSKDNNFAHYMLGTYYLDNKYSEKALSQFEIAYQLDSTDPFTLFQIGNTYIQTGDIITGWKYYEMIITSNTPNIKILTNMGTLSLNNNRPELALKFFVTALKTPVERSHHIQSKLIALLYAGHTAYLLNRVEEATSYFKKFTESKLANKNELCEFAIDELLKINMQNNKIRSYELVTNLCMESLIR